MKHHVYITPEGIINLCTVPVPDGSDFAENFQDGSGQGRYDQSGYEATLKHCKESSIEFEDQMAISNYWPRSFTLDRDTFYPVDVTVEIVEQYWTGSPLNKAMSRIPEWLDIPRGHNEYGAYGSGTRKVARLKVDSKEEQKPVTPLIVCYNPDVLPKRSEDAPEFSVTVGIIDEHGLDGLGYYCFDDKEWSFHTDTIVDYNEPGAETKWKWYYIPVTWEKASEPRINEESTEDAFNDWMEYGRLNLAFSLEAAEKGVKNPSEYVFNKLSEKFTITRKP